MGKRLKLLGKGNGAATGWHPGLLSGLVLWLDADDSGTLFQDSLGTTPAVADGDPIGRWEDKSSSAYVFIQTTASRRATLKIGVQNSRNGVRLDGVDDVLESLGTPQINPATAFVVFRENVAVEIASPLCCYPLTGHDYNQDPSLLFATGTSTQLMVIFSPKTGGGVNYVEKLGAGPTLAGIYAARLTTTTIEGYHDGSLFGSHTRSLGTVNCAGIYIGARRISSLLSGPYLNGDVYEVLIYNTALTATDRGLVEDYLRTKWGTP